MAGADGDDRADDAPSDGAGRQAARTTNSCYNACKAIEIGRLLEANDIRHFEERVLLGA